MIGTLVVMRLLVAIICAIGSIWLLSKGIEGWGWFLIATLILGCVTASGD